MPHSVFSEEFSIRTSLCGLVSHLNWPSFTLWCPLPREGQAIHEENYMILYNPVVNFFRDLNEDFRLDDGRSCIAVRSWLTPTVEPLNEGQGTSLLAFEVGPCSEVVCKHTKFDVFLTYIIKE